MSQSDPLIFHGSVVSGMGLGRKLGFPTFNLKVDPLPELAYGVYAVRVQIGDVSYNALMHFGPKPTVSMTDIFCEVYILKFPEGLEVVETDIQVLGKIRDVVKFAGLDELVAQMKCDEKMAIEHFFNFQS